MDPLARLLDPYRAAVAGTPATDASIARDPLLSLLLPQLTGGGSSSGAAGVGRVPGGDLLELIYGGNALNPHSADPSHQGHLHLSANKIGQIGRWLQGLGFDVGENPKFGGVAPGVHSPTGWHPKGKAVDVNYGGGGRWETEADALHWLEKTILQKLG